MRIRIVAAVVGALAAVAATAAAQPQARVSVFFLQGEQLARVTRPGATPAETSPNDHDANELSSSRGMKREYRSRGAARAVLGGFI